MLKMMLSGVFAAAAIVISAPAQAQAQAQAGAGPAMKAESPAKAAGRRTINGVDYYYEVHGEGDPLLLLHGGLGSMDMFAPMLAMLTEKHQVILVDLHGHGRTPLGERPIDPLAIGADMAALTAALGHEQVDVIGYSFGGMTALHMAASAPQRVRRLVLVSAPYARDGFFPEMLPQQAQVSAAMAPHMKETPMYRTYAAVAPDIGAFPRLLDEMGRVMRTPYDYSAAVKKLTMPVMLVYGDSDMIRPEHIVDFYQMLGGGLKDAGWQREHMAKNRLAILPDVTHYDMFLAPELYRTALTFLEGGGDRKSWAETAGE